MCLPPPAQPVGDCESKATAQLRLISFSSMILAPQSAEVSSGNNFKLVDIQTTLDKMQMQ